MKAELIEKSENIANQSKEIQDIVNIILADNMSDLDDYVFKVRKRFIEAGNIPSDEELNDIVIRIPLYLYYCNTIQEQLGVKEDLAKLIKTDKYNKVLLEAVGTVKEKEAFAQQHISTDQIIHLAYISAYKQMQQKSNLALELLSSAKKIQSIRIAEKGMSKGVN